MCAISSLSILSPSSELPSFLRITLEKIMLTASPTMAELTVSAILERVICICATFHHIPETSISFANIAMHLLEVSIAASILMCAISSLSMLPPSELSTCLLIIPEKILLTASPTIADLTVSPILSYQSVEL
uniref:Uncharacterized protein n=1 Tax=Oryza punctata TaxID=4537 RepID=A0A0E0KM28_ORYPU